ncbi:uncharacterized protein L201_002471 [Kwoniella dendrophila CBS 6074]|uniref:Autophagy-related protein 14 n=1 Tax=Kwoniella dendrophila CBS 6074 TaxID=1295534 RepID=A0AAX4JQA7_9TREE
MSSNTSACPCCHQTQHPLYCARCLREGISLHREALKSIQTSIAVLIARSTALLDGNEESTGFERNHRKGVNAWITLRAEVDNSSQRRANLNESIQHIEARIASIRMLLDPLSPPPSESRHIGRPFMKANTPFVSTTKWREKNVLWMSSTASIASKIKPRNSLSASKIFSQPNISAIIDKSTKKHRQFLTSFALLSFSVAYLAWSQGVQGIGIREGDDHCDDSDEDNPRPASRTSSPIIKISATSVLELIAAIANAPLLGQKTHEPGTRSVVRHLGFGLDVAKVVRSVLSAEENRWGSKSADCSGEELSEGWDLLDADGS